MVTLCTSFLCEPPSPGLDPVRATASCCRRMLPSATVPPPCSFQPPANGVFSCRIPCGAAGGSWVPFTRCPWVSYGQG